MENNQITIQPEESYKVIRKSVLTAQSKVYTVVNSAHFFYFFFVVFIVI